MAEGRSGYVSTHAATRLENSKRERQYEHIKDGLCARPSSNSLSATYHPIERKLPMYMKRAITASLAAGALLLFPACNDEDGDGATTDEEIQDLENQGEEIGNEIEEEVDGQDTGSNEDGE